VKSTETCGDREICRGGSCIDTCGDYYYIEETATTYCRDKTNYYSGFHDCEEDGEYSYFYRSGTNIRYRCYDLYNYLLTTCVYCVGYTPFDCGIYDGPKTAYGVAANCVDECENENGHSCDSECIAVRDCAPANEGNENTKFSIGCIYTSGSCTTDDKGEPGTCSNDGRCLCDTSATRSCCEEMGYYWDIGGEADPDGCCGDDNEEYVLTRVVDPTMDKGYSSSITDDACCNLANSCVDESTCYPHDSTSHDADGDGDKDFCQGNSWEDCLDNDQCSGNDVCYRGDCIECEFCDVDFGLVTKDAKEICEEKGTPINNLLSCGDQNCDGTPPEDIAQFYGSGNLIMVNCKDMSTMSIKGISEWGFFEYSVDCDAVNSDNSYVVKNCTTECGTDCDSECVVAKHCDSGRCIDVCPNSIGCVYLDGNSCTTDEGYPAICSQGKCGLDCTDADDSDYCCIEDDQYGDSSFAWDIGGDVGPNECCGDDSGEYIRTKAVSVKGDTTESTDSNDDACCNGNNDCVDGSKCTNSGSSKWVNPNHEAACYSGSWYDCDYNSNYCENYCGGKWNVGGERDSTTCCGDDAGENYESRSASNTMDNGYSSSSSDDACCDASNDCVHSNGCYASSHVNTDVDGDTDNDYCNAGTWYDCLNSNQCPSGFSCESNNCIPPACLDADESSDCCTDPNEATGDLSYRWSIGGDIDPNECCGDDSNENVLHFVSWMSSEQTVEVEDKTDDACCDNENDCVYDDACYSPDTTPPVDVEGDNDTDYCTSTGLWKDCKTDDECGSTRLFGEYEVCNASSHYCLVNCFAEACLEGEPICYDEVLDETLYCVTTYSNADRSNFVKEPKGNNPDEGYCPLGYNYEYDSRLGEYKCKKNHGIDVCYNTLAQSSCGIVNIPSMLLNCYPDSSDYCDFELRRTGSQIIPSTEEPKQTINLGPRKTFHGLSCIDTDNGLNTTGWGCTYIANLSGDDGETIIAQIACDDNNTATTIIEHYCNGSEIEAYQYDCKDEHGNSMVMSDAEHMVPPSPCCFVEGTNPKKTKPQIIEHRHEHD
jgi:hypothetical protein